MCQYFFNCLTICSFLCSYTVVPSYSNVDYWKHVKPAQFVLVCPKSVARISAGVYFVFYFWSIWLWALLEEDETRKEPRTHKCITSSLWSPMVKSVQKSVPSFRHDFLSTFLKFPFINFINKKRFELTHVYDFGAFHNLLCGMGFAIFSVWWFIAVNLYVIWSNVEICLINYHITSSFSK